MATGATIGWAKLTEDAAGRVHVNVQVDGMTPGRHGIHLHAIGSCIGPAFTSAGGHHNPLGAAHGLDSPPGAHAGDLPNLDVNVVGRGRLQATTDRATLTPGHARLVRRRRVGHHHPCAEDDQAHRPDRQQRRPGRLRGHRGGWMSDADLDLGRFAEPSLYILVSLSDGPKHGYAIMTDVESISGSPMGPGTLYGALARWSGAG